MKKYAIIDVTTGDYTYYDESQDLISTLAKNILDAHLALTHNQLWSIVNFNDDGSQTWRNAVGDEVPDPLVVKSALAAEIAAFLAQSESTTSTNNTTVG